MEREQKLRYYQIQAVNAVMASLLQSNHRIFLQLATGTGKTAILAQLVESIQKSYRNAKLLILTSRTSIKDQIAYTLQQRDIVFSNENLYDAPVALGTYNNVRSALRKSLDIPRFQFIISIDGDDATDEELEAHFDNAFLIGFTADREIKKGWFKDATCIFRYSFEDAVRDGLIMPTLTPNNTHGLAIEGFCARLLSQFNGKLELERKSCDFGDFLFHVENETLLVECKSYRNRQIPIQTLELAVAQMQQYIDSDKRFRGLLIVFCEVSESFKESVFKKCNITLWDISNLLFYSKDNSELLNALMQLTYFPISGIKPFPSCGWHPDIVIIKNIEDNPKEDICNLKFRLNHCKAGKKNFQEYEEVCTDIIQYLFGKEFTITSNQHKTGDELFRMDLLCSLKGTSAFWELLINHYNSRFIVFEFKNYAQSLPQNMIFITEKYLFNAALRNVAIIISRKGFTKNASIAAAGCLKESGKLILNITDDDLVKMLHQKLNGDEPADYLLEKLERMLMSISK